MGKLFGHFTMYLVLVLALAVGALAQVPTTCPGPKQFEGRFRRFDRERKYEVQGAMIYDEDSKRVREFEDETIAGAKEVYLKLKLYNENKEYILDLKTRKCNVTTPRHGFHPYGVPKQCLQAGRDCWSFWCHRRVSHCGRVRIRPC